MSEKRSGESGGTNRIPLSVQIDPVMADFYLWKIIDESESVTVAMGLSEGLDRAEAQVEAQIEVFRRFAEATAGDHAS